MDILLAERLVPEALAWLQERHTVACRPELAIDASLLRKALYNAQAVVLPRKVVVTREFLDFAPRLRAIARMHVGTDNTDLEACRDRKVRVIQASTANVRSNAEYLLASLLLLYRRGLGATLGGNRHAEVRLGRELFGSVVGIVGLAPTAHALAPMLHGLGVRLVGYDPAIHHTAPIWSRLHIQPLGLNDVLSQADAVSVQVMYASRYQGFVNDKLLAHCKPGQVWVGISRSQLFDAAALARALADGRIDACLLDGAEAGFASRGSPLHDASNLYLTPRLGTHTREARLRASWYVAHRIHETLTTQRTSIFDQIPSQPVPFEDSLGAGESAP
ncbi:NAD(P)-dependent oxidoreductase [Ramlibacter tataouinensis]|uniref:D-3-phosphoglycerate dehydrogenase (Phosphoglycerate dehydrogenase)-like protein n=1 Tax=Ramlibacter tataouinensis (strain ATCC BAA-407 / DSM 14655 / LMG 21543 / TTB310) TaxID=365046 RepID=F5XXC1_RAMTT|nr:NAD(P)-dependent oxidoreductase [Ramlibacter tataouinensis]AEG94256.1 D-3-phosphoglycerate dehydrogenase (phosphoglycerate dehydrogenase)-like protein [Ramlibacter tataouinensis TTB310]